MGFKQSRYKNGVLVHTSDTRTLEETKANRIQDVNMSLVNILKKTDWEVTRESDASSDKKMKPETFNLRKSAREIADVLNAKIEAAVDREAVDQINPDIKDYIK